MEELKEGWRRVKLGEISTFLSGYAFKGSLFSEEGHKVIKIKNVNGKFVDINNTEKYPKELCEKLAKYKIKNNDILIAMTGAGSVGRVSKFKYKGNNSFYINQRVGKIIIDSEKANSEFIFQIISTQKYEKILFDMANGSGQPNLSPKLISEVEIELPPLETQEKIASILSALDDKIEINNEMNKTLEEMAQTLFKRWFIDFDFPNENGEPYRSSGGKMVESELGEIPEGWKIDSIYELADYINGTSFKSNEYGDHGLPVIKIVELKNGITDSTKFCISDKDKKFHLKNGEILFSWSGNPQTSIDIFIWSLGKAILNQHTFKVVPYNQKMDSYIYFLLKYLKPKFCDIASNKQTTGLGHVTVKDLKNLKIAFNYEEIYKFCEISQNIFKKLLDNQQEIQSLTEIRDTLLPKLMSGEIEV
ncbi:restriction endonuclease subunit S [Cetobacterium sp.]|uniref:restriction endonuclease subunit S n=1 Tax=Cetobacterium sp. TaxID=2071632 RepID=UPI003F346A76